jgi:CelD/BcsL family acetyltransferase involved in cellulose biosynthesis
MSVDIEEADREAWNRHVERSPQAGTFHRYEALETLADHAGAELTALAGYKGQEPVGLFPVFAVEKWPVTAVVSPPPALHVPYLGPALLNMGKLKQRKAERRQRRFLEGAVDAVDRIHDPLYVHLRTVPGYPDFRPLQWHGFDVTPRHTYVVDLDRDREDLLASFSSDARSNVRNTDDDAYDIAVAGRDSIAPIIQQVRSRFAAQDVPFNLSADLVEDLYDRLPEGAVRPYVCRVDGVFAGGIVALDDGQRVSRWQGGVKVDGVDLPVNDLLDWRVMADALERGRAGYDLVGADTERISSYKSKFAPELRRFHALERGSPVVSFLVRRYRALS